jgi:uncharacterized protein involved in type VI secretion and phage assembly
MRKLSIAMAAVLVAGATAMAWEDNAQAGKAGSYQGPTTQSGTAQGPYYFFQHSDGSHRLVPKDDNPHPRTNKAGSNGGTTGIPSAGRETIINFVEGDPDKPIVTGNTNPRTRRGGRHTP